MFHRFLYVYQRVDPNGLCHLCVIHPQKAIFGFLGVTLTDRQVTGSELTKVDQESLKFVIGYPEISCLIHLIRNFAQNNQIIS